MAGFRTKLGSHGVSYGRRSTSIFPACMVYSLTQTMFLYLLLFIQLLTTYPSSHQFFGRQQWHNLQECMYNYIFLCMYTVTIFRRMYFCEFIMFHWQSTWKRLIGVPLQPRVATSMFSSLSCQRACDYRIKSWLQPHIRNRDILHFLSWPVNHKIIVDSSLFIVDGCFVNGYWWLMFVSHSSLARRKATNIPPAVFTLLQQRKPLRSLWPTLKARIVPIIDPNVPTKAFTHETFVYLEA